MAVALSSRCAAGARRHCKYAGPANRSGYPLRHSPHGRKITRRLSGLVIKTAVSERANRLGGSALSRRGESPGETTRANRLTRPDIIAHYCSPRNAKFMRIETFLTVEDQMARNKSHTFPSQITLVVLNATHPCQSLVLAPVDILADESQLFPPQNSFMIKLSNLTPPQR